MEYKKEHKRRKIAEYANQKSLQDTLEILRFRVFFDIPDASQHVCRAKNDQDGQ